MNIGQHQGKRAVLALSTSNTFGYIFDTIQDEGYELFIADEKHDRFHNAGTYFNNNQENWNEAYTKRCYWVLSKHYELAKKILL